MTGKKKVDLSALHMGEREFDRLMRGALQVKVPPKAKQPKAKQPKRAGRKAGKR